MPVKKTLTLFALAACTSPAWADDPATQDDIKALRERLDRLEQQVNQNQKDISANSQEIHQAENSISYTVQRTFNDNARAAARIDNELYGDDLKGFFHLPNTSTIMRIGGYIKVDANYDTKPMGDPEQFIVSSIPVGTPQKDDQFHMNAKQSRINFEVRRPTDLGPLRIFIENDFYGDNGSTNFHLRHAYAQVDNMLGGYTYSTLVDADALPNTLDFAGPGGAIYLRTTQIRLSTRLGSQGNASIAIEKPASEVDLSNTPTGTNDSTPLPDLIARGRWESAWGHVQVGAVVRRIATENATTSDTVTGYGGSLAGAYNFPWHDVVQASFSSGSGFGHYYSDLNGGAQDAAFDSSGRLKALQSTGGFAAYQHFWNEHWNSSVVYGLLHIGTTDAELATAPKRDEYSAVNLIWNPKGSLNLGVEFLNGRLEQKDGLSQSAARIQFSIQVDLVH